MQLNNIITMKIFSWRSCSNWNGSVIKIAEERIFLLKGTSDIIKDICLKYNLPIFSDTKTDDLIEAISLDKNLNKKLSLVLLKEIGNSYVYQSDLSLIKEKDRV